MQPKEQGGLGIINMGLGIINMKIQNNALLLKFLKKFYNNADIPLVKLT
jgi:hypothetical protein